MQRLRRDQGIATRQLRLLVVCPYAPYPPVGGGKLRIFHLVNRWLEFGHNVTLWICPLDEPAALWPNDGPKPHQIIAMPALRRSSLRSKICALLSPYPEEVWSRRVHRRDPPITIERPDLIVLMQAHVGRLIKPFDAMGIPVVLDQQNVERDIARQIAALQPTRLASIRSYLDIPKWWWYERSLERRAAQTTAVSESDAASFRSMAPSARVVVRPSGADIATRTYVDHGQNRQDRLVMTGTLGYLPNLDAAMWMIERILPVVRQRRPSAHLVLVGASPPASLIHAAPAWVEVVGRVPDVAPYLDDADLFVAPLRAGGGTRLKLLEAFAAGIPVVATTLASQGIDVRHGVDVETADAEVTITDAIVRMLEDVGRRRSHAESARRLVEDKYDWRKIATEYEADLLAIAERHRPMAHGNAADGTTSPSG